MSTAKKIWSAWMHVCAVVVTLALLGGIGFYTYLWFVTDGFHPINDNAESCLHDNGTWDAEQEICVKAS